MNFLVARVNYITPNGTFQTIGKVKGNQAYYYKPGDGGETVTSGDFEVLSCQPRDPVIQCGTLLEFTANDITTLGFNSGTYTDGSVVYPGSGNMAACYNQNPSPARLTTSNSLSGPGAYSQCQHCFIGFCSTANNYDAIDPRFFAKHNSLTWVMTTGANYQSVLGAIPVGGLYVGRINVTTSSGTYQQVNESN